MLLDHIKIQQSPQKDDSVKLRQANLDELIILVPFSGFTIKVDTPLFNIEGISPAEVVLIGISPSEFLIRINTPEFDLTTLVPSLVLEVINPDGVVIIRIVAPPEES